MAQAEDQQLLARQTQTVLLSARTCYILEKKQLLNYCTFYARACTTVDQTDFFLAAYYSSTGVKTASCVRVSFSFFLCFFVIHKENFNYCLSANGNSNRMRS